MQRKDISIKGWRGTWAIIKDFSYKGGSFHLLEHEVYGEDVEMLWVNDSLKVIVDEVYNGVDDLIEYIDSQEVFINCNSPTFISSN